jgi:hypothetical protein
MSPPGSAYWSEQHTDGKVSKNIASLTCCSFKRIATWNPGMVSLYLHNTPLHSSTPKWLQTNEVQDNPSIKPLNAQSSFTTSNQSKEERSIKGLLHVTHKASSTMNSYWPEPPWHTHILQQLGTKNMPLLLSFLPKATLSRASSQE